MLRPCLLLLLVVVSLWQQEWPKKNGRMGQRLFYLILVSEMVLTMPPGMACVTLALITIMAARWAKTDRN